MLGVVAALAGQGCIIGTWPQPDDDSDSGADFDPGGGNGADDDGGGGDGAASPGEECDGLDDDGDGTVDEGCPCDPAVIDERTCIDVVDGLCAMGVQRCEGDRLSRCLELEPGIEARSEATIVLEVEDPVLVAGQASSLDVVARPRARCDGVRPARVRVELVSVSPRTTFEIEARDDGVAPDALADDGRYEVQLPNPFGAGVPAQTLSLRAITIFDANEVVTTTEVELENAEPEAGR